MSPNLKAFLDTISISEGTYGVGDDGYNVLVGGCIFHNGYIDHPNILIDVNDRGLKSTAAGRYQILHRYWVIYKSLLNLPDFSPESQDAVAIQIIKERKALDDVEIGNFASAIEKCSNIWASFPNAGYKQHENSLKQLAQDFIHFGGTIEPQNKGEPILPDSPSSLA